MALDGGKNAIGIYCELSRAFDCVVDEKLLYKVNRCEIRSIPLKWFSSFLSGRQKLSKLTIQIKIIMSLSSVIKYP